ncbi:unnamed protein product [Urochloa humidicola]
MVITHQSARRSAAMERVRQWEEDSDSDVDAHLVVEDAEFVPPPVIDLEDAGEEDAQAAEEDEQPVLLVPPPPPVVEPVKEDQEQLEEEEPEEVEFVADGDDDGGSEAGPEHPAHPPSLPPEKWTLSTHRHDGAGRHFPLLLEKLFEQLGYPAEIKYVGHKATHPRYPEEWDVFVNICKPDYDNGGTEDVRVYRWIGTRSTFIAGMEDAARQAITSLLYDEIEVLTDTVWSHFPQRAPNQVITLIYGIRNQLSAESNLQADYTATLYSYADGTTDELRNATDLLAAERLEN